jgi:hypothetical protein
VPLGRWLLRQATAQLARWRVSGLMAIPGLRAGGDPVRGDRRTRG